MASTYSALKIELIATGEQSGTWGATTNVNLGDAALGEAITGSADVAFSSADVTITLTDTNTTQAARNLRLNLTGTSGGARNLILGSGCQIEKLYLVNNGLADAVTVKNTTGTGIAIPAGKSAFVFNNGTNVVEAVNYAASISTGAITCTSLTDSGLTSGRVTYAGTAGLLQDSANLTFNGTTLTANTIGAYTLSGTIAGGGNQINNVIIGTSTPLAGSFTTINASTSITNAGLTSGRVVTTSTSGLLTDSSNLTWDTNTLNILSPSPSNTPLNLSSSNTSNTLIQLTNANAAKDLISRFRQNAGGGNWWDLTMEGSTNGFTFDYNDGEILRLTTAGNLGLGVTPDASDWNASMRVFHAYQNTTNGAGVKLQSSNAKMVLAAGNALTYVGSIDAVPLLFVTTASEKMRLDTSGILGLGVTPSPWGNGFKALEVGYIGCGINATSNNQTNVVGNAYGSSGWKYSATGYASSLYQQNGSGSHAWSYAAAGTAGAAITWIEAMQISTSGNVGIGTSSPASALYVKRTSGNSGIYTDYNGTNVGRIESASNGNLYIGITTGSGDISIGNTANANAFILNSSGNVGIGVTPSAWGGSGQVALQIGTGTSGTANFAGGGTKTLISSNQYYNGSVNKYINNGYAQAMVLETDSSFSWIQAASGTAGNTASFFTKMTLTSAGQLLIGSTSATDAQLVVSNAGTNGMEFSTTAISGENRILSYNRSTSVYQAQNLVASQFKFFIAGTQSMTLDSSGNLLVGTTDTTKTNIGFRVEGGVANTSRASTGSFFEFYDTGSGSRVGYISNSGGVATLYNTTSDQRLKTNIVDAPSGNIDDIKVRSFDWIVNGSHQPYGMVAQELIEVAPYAVNKPENSDEMMAVDYSKLVPMMIKEIQDLKQRIATLENK